MKPKKTASILKKFLLFNFTTFSVLGLITIFYLKAIQPNLVKERAINHKIIISNTIDHLKRLNVDYSSDGIRTFLLSTRFLFQSLDRVQFYDLSGNLIGDTNILDLDQNVFTRPDVIIEETIDGQIKKKSNTKKFIKEQNKDLIKEVKIFDVYKGENIDSGKKSIAFNVILEPQDKTLSEGDIDKISKKIISTVQDSTGATLRS